MLLEDMLRVLCAIPCLDEEVAIGSVVLKAKAHVADVLVVDDGSTDKTADVARAAGDAQRLQRYRTALENCLVFVTTLQYAESNTQHFADWYRHNVLVGGFHESHQDGNLRIDYTQHAVSALVQYLTYVAEAR